MDIYKSCRPPRASGGSRRPKCLLVKDSIDLVPSAHLSPQFGTENSEGSGSIGPEEDVLEVGPEGDCHHSCSRWVHAASRQEYQASAREAPD